VVLLVRTISFINKKQTVKMGTKAIARYVTTVENLLGNRVTPNSLVYMQKPLNKIGLMTQNVGHTESN
jgi:hypothetical protein